MLSEPAGNTRRFASHKPGVGDGVRGADRWKTGPDSEVVVERVDVGSAHVQAGRPVAEGAETVIKGEARLRRRLDPFVPRGEKSLYAFGAAKNFIPWWVLPAIIVVGLAAIPSRQQLPPERTLADVGTLRRMHKP